MNDSIYYKNIIGILKEIFGNLDRCFDINTKQLKRIKKETKKLRKGIGEMDDLEYYKSIHQLLNDFFDNRDRCFDVDIERLAKIELETNTRILSLFPTDEMSETAQYRYHRINEFFNRNRGNIFFDIG